MVRRLMMAAALVGVAALAGGCGDNGKPKGDPTAPPPKGGPGMASDTAPPPGPPPR